MSLRMDATNQQQKKILYFIGASLALHILIAALLPLAEKFSLPDTSVLDRAVMIDLDPKTLAQMEESAKQIVQTEKAENTEAAKDAKFLGERNQTVQEETRSRNVDAFRSADAGAKARPMPPVQASKNLSFKNLAPTANGLEPLTKKEVERREASLQPPGAQGGATNDYLKDTKEGDRTMLSTREFVYYGYYNRIRQRLEQSWQTKLRSVLETQFLSGRRIASEKDYVTKLVVILDSNGRITGVKVLEASGARDLDQVAIDAFNSAGPFPDPPKGLVDEDGTIKIRWDFILQS